MTTAYSAFVLAQAQPQPNGSSLGSTTGPTTGTGSGFGSVSATGTTTNSTATGTTGGMDSTPAAGVGQGTGTGGVGTSADQLPSDITTVDPMDPSRDSRMGSDSTMGNTRNRRAMGTSSGTTIPGSTTNPVR